MKKKLTTNEEYLNKLFTTCKKIEKLSILKEKTRLNTTELRLIGEIILSDYEGERLISTQLAKKLSVTRSAISQIVNNLEKRGIVKRVPDEIDRKIAYVELTDYALEIYQTEKRTLEDTVGVIVERFGRENLDQLFALADKFWTIVEDVNQGAKK